jgi:phage-related tail protein
MPTLKITKRELTELVKAVKKEIDDDCLADYGDEIPGIQLTVATTDGKEWAYQMGDNSYSGSAYFYRHWAVVSVHRRSNSKSVAEEIIDQLNELLADASDDE